MIKSSLIKTVNNAINHYLQLDPESINQLEKLEGKRVAIELQPFGKRMNVEFVDHRLELMTETTAEPDVTLKGSPLRLLAAMRSKENRQKFFAEDIQIEGNAELGQQLIDLFDRLEIDWEEQLSRFTGDVPAYHVGNFMRKMTGWFRDSSESITENVSEYIHEEAGWLPTREALADLFNDIDTLRMDTDRTAARVKALKKQLGNQLSDNEESE